MLNYVILTTFFFFIQCGTSLTHVTQQSSPHVWVSTSLWVSRPLCGPWTSPQDLFVGHEQVLLISPCLMGFSFHQRIIHGSLVRHPWEPRVNPAHTSMGTPHIHVHENLAPHHYLAPLAIFFCWAFLFFSKIFVCGPFRLSLSLLSRDYKHLTTFAARHHGLWYYLLGG